jgi:outer membrane protein assembly factor BamB
MTQDNESPASLGRLTRRAALLGPLGLLSGCGLFNGSWFNTPKVPLPGKREDILFGQSTLQPDDSSSQPVSVPSAVVNPDWPQAGGNPTHVMGNLAAGRLSEAWHASIGARGGYRSMIPCAPVVAGGRVFTMDPDAVIRACDLRSGDRIWETETRGKKDRGTNVGGGISVDGNTLYAATGLAELLAIDTATGAIHWRKAIDVPARSAPTIADGKLFFPNAADQLIALSQKDGSPIWNHQAQSAQTDVLGQPAPAFQDGIVIAGFGSGDIVALSSDSGSVIWGDSLASAGSSSNLADISAIRGLPVISNGRVFAIGLGGLMLSLDLPSGRRLWQHNVAGGDTPWVAGDWLFILTLQQQLAAISLDNGQVRWIVDLPRWKNEKKQTGDVYWRGPVMVDGTLITVGTTHEIQVRSAADGRLINHARLPDEATITPVVADRTLLVLTNDGSVTAFR